MTRTAVKTASLSIIAICASACGNQTDDSGSNSACLKTLNDHKFISGGTFTMGADKTYPEETKRRAAVSDFNIDTHEVTNSQFAKFIDATDYVTSAERPQPGFDAPGAAVFMLPTDTNPNWWRFVEGATWQHPEGPDSSIKGQDNYPVVQVSYEDALAYANWAKRDLPTESEWEYAAKAGAETLYVWGDERTPSGTEMANTWQGAFPIQNTKSDGYSQRAPVGCYAKNNFGLYDMIGNVWEWTSSETQPQKAGITGTHVIKGGSFLCAENFCARYRSAARQFQEADLPTNHIGFRTVSRSTPNTSID